MNLWHEPPSGPDWPEIIYVVVEIPRKSQNKYEYDEKGGFIKLDRPVLLPPLPGRLRFHSPDTAQRRRPPGRIGHDQRADLLRLRH
jgi:hypothetical protein